jgi:hypothetical protein
LKVCNFIATSNTEGKQVYANDVREFLNGTGYVRSEHTIKRDLNLMGFVYGKGHRINILHDTAANIQYRKKYLDKRLSNLNANGLPIKPEVFLDESYCHLDHHSKQTWFEPGTTIRKRGCKPILVISGAFVVFSQKNKMVCEFVKESILI